MLSRRPGGLNLTELNEVGLAMLSRRPRLYYVGLEMRSRRSRLYYVGLEMLSRRPGGLGRFRDGMEEI